VKGNQFARAGLEIAWWVLEAKRQGVPLHVALGGTGDRVAVGADFGIQESLDILMEKIQGALDQGFPRIKLKFRPGWDLNMVEAVRSTFPRATFHVDCNAAYTLADVDLFRALDRYRLAMIEQPLADDGMSLVAHADLQAQLETPVCLDESAVSLAHVQAAIRLGSCKVVNIKMARVGGLSASREIQALCAEHGIPCWVGGMLESAIGGAICAELATLPNFTYPGDIFPSSYFYRNDLGKPEIALSGPGEVSTSRVPGIAQEPDPDLLKQWTVAHAPFRA
jgi:O-succinylbenzoate synthase